MFEENLVSIPECSLNVARSLSSKPPLVLFHGVLRRWTDFLSVIPPLCYRWQVIGLDFRGHGKSTRTPGKYHVIDYGRDAEAILNRVTDERAVIYGHSLGSYGG